MITDASIREQGYIYFLYEAPELLQTIEQELFSLAETYSTVKVHNLMRATHTIKGGAANIGLDVINKVAHSLEDVFKALYNPNVKIDAELRTLLFQAFECLQLPLMAELSHSSIDSEEILERAASVFAQLQEKLGSAYVDEVYIPTSEELGFDIVRSIFDTGVTQRLESISEVIKSPPENDELINLLRSHAEVFLGLAQSLNLPGFGVIAQTTLTALETHPSLVLKIAEIALADWQRGREAVLAGDRSSGGEPSAALQELTVATLANHQTRDAIDDSSVTFVSKFSPVSLRDEASEFYTFLSQSDKTKAKFYLKIIRYILGWFNHELGIPYQELSLTLLIPKKEADNTVNYIEDWLFKFLDFLQDEKDSHSLYLYRHGVILTILLFVAKFQEQRGNCDVVTIQILQNKISNLIKEYQNYTPVTREEKKWVSHPKLQKLLEIKETSTAAEVSDRLVESIWGEECVTSADDVEVNNDEFSESSNSLAVNELLVTDTTEKVFSDSTLKNLQKIEEKFQNSRPTGLIRVDVETLNCLNYLAGELLTFQKQRTLQDEQIKEIIQGLLQFIQKSQTTLSQLLHMSIQTQIFDTQHKQNFVSVDFDSLEMDEYTEAYIKLHEATEETLQLQEAAESLDLIFKQATQVQEKQQYLALSIIDNLVEARMSPLGNVLNRFPQMVQNLGDVYGKTVELKLTGKHVLVDKAISEKLYDPLLQLVRNAFDHGIEPPEIRSQHGKPSQGLIEISAYHQGSQTIIEVHDDGQGLSFEKIRSKAIEMNLLNPDDVTRGYVSNPSDEELLQFLFSPGFSTASKISEISGRGMGLDIVRAQLQALNGSISVQSFPNRGTTFILKIPFSMTIDKLMLVEAGGIVYALLLENIEKILLPSAVSIKEFEGRKVLYWKLDQDERMVSIRTLSELLSYNCSFNSSGNLQHKLAKDEQPIMSHPMLLLRQNQEFLALEVDQIIGEQELVIKPLGQAIAPPKYVYGCSTLANGNLILVIDSALLLECGEIPEKIDVMALATNRSSQTKALPMSVSSIEPPLLPASALGQSHEITPKVILVVDDAMSVRQTLSLTFQKYGYQVLQAQHGIEALEQLQQHPEVQIIISDLEMPRMNGFELLSNVRQNPNLASKPVVILTSRSSEKHRQLAQELGATTYLTKPYLEQEFLSTIESLI